jgi:antitoxin PrlF
LVASSDGFPTFVVVLIVKYEASHRGVNGVHRLTAGSFDQGAMVLTRGLGLASVPAGGSVPRRWLRATMESFITMKGRVTIPKPIRERLGLKPGDQVKFFIHPDGGIVLLPKRPASSLRGIVKSWSGEPVTLDGMTEAASEGAVESAYRSDRGR